MINEVVDIEVQKFEDFTYQRPDMEQLSADFELRFAAFSQADTFAEQEEILEEINEMRATFSSMYNLCHIRHTINTRDAFYEAENDFFNQALPKFQAVNTQLHELLLHTPFRAQFEQKWGPQFFRIAELNRRTFSPAVLPDLQEENRLSTEYVRIKAGAKIEFQGEEYNLSGLLPLELSADRATRKAASEAKWSFFAEHAGEVENIFDQLVKTRHGIAQKLGYAQFSELAYDRLGRSDYAAADLVGFREEIAQYIVPITSRLYERQRKRLALDQLNYYDEEFRFASGNPKPQGNPQWIVEQAQRMYQELSPETAEFFNFMQEAQLMDLENKEGKATGGYCTYIENNRAPYIFSNFNGTSGDVDVLTHECGHAFQVFCSRDIGLTEYKWPTYEACEIHSMSMEFFAWPWMNLFFGAESNKYKFMHLSNSLYFLPYGTAIDEFQHLIYANPEFSPAERNRLWSDLEQKYLPQRQYGDNVFLQNGGYWHKQGHVFTSPFYYIDYVLAQICAFQYWKWDQEDHAAAWESYLRLCKAGGSKSFLELVDLAGIRSPFEKGCVQSVATEIANWLDHIDDSRF
jgi:M3 family oligoendopeptidase